MKSKPKIKQKPSKKILKNVVPQKQTKPEATKVSIQNLKESKWLLVGGSVIGKSHIENKIPCQDSNAYESIGENWGIAVTSDGAGSAKKSEFGSKYISVKAVERFKKLICDKKLIEKNELFTEKEWDTLSFDILKELRVGLQVYAKEKNFNLKDLACTVIVVVYSPIGLMVTHIGDGRAGYYTEKDGWKSMITPWKGEESNSTVFITTDVIWNKSDNYVESRVINEKITAFTLMSDGCENHSFLCSQIDSKTQKWVDPNLPSSIFFNNLIKTLTKFNDDNLEMIEIKEKWTKFLESGNDKLLNESDDKTMILGVLLDK